MKNSGINSWIELKKQEAKRLVINMTTHTTTSTIKITYDITQNKHMCQGKLIIIIIKKKEKTKRKRKEKNKNIKNKNGKFIIPTKHHSFQFNIIK